MLKNWKVVVEAIPLTLTLFGRPAFNLLSISSPVNSGERLDRTYQIFNFQPIPSLHESFCILEVMVSMPQMQLTPTQNECDFTPWYFSIGVRGTHFQKSHVFLRRPLPSFQARIQIIFISNSTFVRSPSCEKVSYVYPLVLGIFIKLNLLYQILVIYFWPFLRLFPPIMLVCRRLFLSLSLFHECSGSVPARFCSSAWKIARNLFPYRLPSNPSFLSLKHFLRPLHKHNVFLLTPIRWLYLFPRFHYPFRDFVGGFLHSREVGGALIFGPAWEEGWHFLPFFVGAGKF